MHEQIAWQFIQEYYTTLNRSPEKLYLFFKKPSTFIHASEGALTAAATGQAQIKEAVAASNLSGCRVVVSTFDSLPSLDDSIIIQVLGDIALSGRPAHRFAQTFVLARNEHKGYYVLNDVMRTISGATSAEPSAPPSASASVEPESLSPGPVSGSAPLAPIAPIAVPAGASSGAEPARRPEVSSEEPAAAEASPEVVPVVAPVVVPEATPASAPASAPAATAPQARTVSAPEASTVPTSAKQSWANVISQAPAPAPAPVSAPTPATPKAERVDRSQKPAEKRDDKRRNQKWHSVYVKHVTRKVDHEQLKKAMREFGAILNMQIDQEYNRGFVDYSERESLERAVRKGSVFINGQEVTIEERRKKK